MKLTRITILSIVLFTGISSFAQTVKIAVAPGQKFTVEMETKMTTTAEVMGQSMESNNNMKSTTLYEVTGAGQDGIALQSTITKMVVSASAMGQEMNYDSDKKDNEGPLAEPLSAMVNKPKAIILDNDGAVVKEDKTEENSGSSMMMLGSRNNGAVELFVPALAGKELKAGQVIPYTGTLKTDKMSTKDAGSYTITSVENGIASISYAGTQTMEGTIEQMGMEMQMSSNNKVNTELQLDVATGRVLAKATVVEISSTIDAMGMSIPATGKTIITTKITPL